MENLSEGRTTPTQLNKARHLVVVTIFIYSTWPRLPHG